MYGQRRSPTADHVRIFATRTKTIGSKL